VRVADPKPIRYPNAARLGYLQGLAQVIAVIRHAIETEVIAQLPRIVQAHAATRPVPVRLDNASDDIDGAFGSAATVIDREVTDRGVAQMAMQGALRVSEHNRGEVSRQL